jgi:hypothetical protein
VTLATKSRFRSGSRIDGRKERAMISLNRKYLAAASAALLWPAMLLAQAPTPSSHTMQEALRASETVVGADATVLRGWARVVAIPPGTDVVVTLMTGRVRRSRFIQASESAIWLRSRSSLHAESFTRDEVTEMRVEDTLTSKRRALGLLGGIAGAVGGAFVGGLAGATLLGGQGQEDLGGLGIGMTIGTVGGAVVAYRTITRRTSVLVFRAGTGDL